MGVHKRGAFAVLVFAALAPAWGAKPALADSMLYLGQVGTNYKYKAEASDANWDPGDVIALTNLDGVTSASEPVGFVVLYSAYGVTWTCVQAVGGPKTLTVQSAVAPGQVAWTIISNDSGSGPITGPEYIPEPATTVLFGGGLIVLAAVAWGCRGSLRYRAWRERRPRRMRCQRLRSHSGSGGRFAAHPCAARLRRPGR
jgi:hypothetical protein